MLSLFTALLPILYPVAVPTFRERSISYIVLVTYYRWSLFVKLLLVLVKLALVEAAPSVFEISRVLSKIGEQMSKLLNIPNLSFLLSSK